MKIIKRINNSLIEIISAKQTFVMLLAGRMIVFVRQILTETPELSSKMAAT